ncbi:uncharacterized protein LOC126847034 [Adelges cooleyi]|uniref:uncharacterized protein LOC126847034 n=1 Tax=Adelges cooleyi TaxID=133065 RepID=UPI00217F263E|nr:uncharacterized protein LOC126847034 [Adelges cooleyi]
MKSTTAIVLAVCFTCSLADADKNWMSVDENTLPEALPELMRNRYDDEQIRKAVTEALENQYKVVSEYNGRVYDPASPYGYFRDEVAVPNTRASSPESDMIFEANTVKGLSNHRNRTIAVRWAEDQVYQEVNWNNLQINGRYKYLTRSRFENGKYQISIDGVKYRIYSPLSANTELYPLSAPRSAISYDKIRASFSGGHQDVFNVKDSPNVRYFIEDVVFQKIADQVLRDMQSNVTAAVRTAVQPYINFKNYSDPHFPEATGRLKNGANFHISNAFASGLNNTVQKLQTLRVDTNDNTVTAQTFVSVHGLAGTFDLTVEEEEGPRRRHRSGAGFTLDRMELVAEHDLVRPDTDCRTQVKIHQPKVHSSYQPGNAQENAQADQRMADAFAAQIERHVSRGFCKFIVGYTKRLAANNP